MTCVCRQGLPETLENKVMLKIAKKRPSTGPGSVAVRRHNKGECLKSVTRSGGVTVKLAPLWEKNSFFSPPKIGGYERFKNDPKANLIK